MKLEMKPIARSFTLFACGVLFGGHIGVLLPSWIAANDFSVNGISLDLLKEELKFCRIAAQPKLSTGSWSSSRSPSSATTTGVQNPLCRIMPSPLGVPSASSLWNNFLPSILDASQLPQDKSYSQRNFTKELLDLIAPKLPNSVKSVTRDWSTVDRITRKLHDRYEHVMKDGPAAEPVRILVMGGSVTKGTNCRSIVRSIRRLDCAWPNRLEQLLNAGGKLVEVTVVGSGGTNSATGAIIQELKLLPEASKNPDIVINNYSTNDMHLLSQRQAAASNSTLHGRVFDMAQDFVRSVLQTKDCGQDPLLLWLDDYLGNEQPEILATTDLSQGIHVLSSYYGFASASYADLVRDRVYGDSKESLFSAHWFKDNGAFVREIHPSSGAHMSMAWTVAYNLLNLATTYCAVEPLLNRPEPETSILVGKPKPLPSGLPPRLDENLSLEHVSDRWRESFTERASLSCQDLCHFSWISGIDEKQDDPEWIERHFQPYLSEKSGWGITRGHPKIGFAPENGIGSTMVLEFEDLPRPIRSVTVLYMKSYGKKWEDSLARVSVSQQQPGTDEWVRVVDEDLEGNHEKKTSETYSTTIQLGEIQSGSSVRIETAHLGGTLFKLMGITVCS